MAVNPVTNKIDVANLAGLDANGNEDTNRPGTVTVIDGETNKTTKIRAGLEPYAVAVNEKTNKIYAANQGSNDVTVIDGATRKTVTIDLAEGHGDADRGRVVAAGCGDRQGHQHDLRHGRAVQHGRGDRREHEQFTVVSTEAQASDTRQTGFIPPAWRSTR